MNISISLVFEYISVDEDFRYRFFHPFVFDFEATVLIDLDFQFLNCHTTHPTNRL